MLQVKHFWLHEGLPNLTDQETKRYDAGYTVEAESDQRALLLMVVALERAGWDGLSAHQQLDGKIKAFSGKKKTLTVLVSSRDELPAVIDPMVGEPDG